MTQHQEIAIILGPGPKLLKERNFSFVEISMKQ